MHENNTSSNQTAYPYEKNNQIVGKCNFIGNISDMWTENSTLLWPCLDVILNKV